MDWLQKLVSFDAPQHASLQSAELTLRGPFPWWIAVLLVAAAGAGILFLYSYEQVRLGAFRRALMGILRTAAIGLLLLLVLRPVIVCEFRGERPRGVALLIDNTQSMMQRDQRLSPQDRLRVAIAENLVPPDISLAEFSVSGNIPPGTSTNPTRAHLVRAVLSHPRLRLLDELRQEAPLRAYLFGQRLRTIGEDADARSREDQFEEELLAAFRADETRTALADAVREILLRSEGDLPAAIVLMTDGRDNASKVPLEEVAQDCARLQVPLHIYGVGSSEVGNLQLKDVGVPETIFYDDAVSVPVRWRCQGFKQGSATITLTLGGKEVSRSEVLVREGEDFREVLTFTPRAGAFSGSRRLQPAPTEMLDLVARIEFKGAEMVKEDNEIKRPVRVIDRRVKVLYVESSPRWEYKFLQTVLLRDRRVQARFFLVNGDPQAMQGSGPFLSAFPATRQDLFAFDLLIVGDVPADYLGAERLRWIRDFVKEGGGLVLIAGRQHAPASYHGTPLAEALPVEFVPAKFPVDASARPQPFSPVLTHFGRRSDMMALADTPDDNLKVWQNLPGFYWHYPVSKLRPGAVALLAHPHLKAGDVPMPLLATHFYGRGPVLLSATDETWRWRYNAGDRTFGRFWGQVIYQFGLPHLLGNPKRVQLELERTENVVGRPGYVYARLFDADYRPLTVERVIARLKKVSDPAGAEGSTARSVPLEAIPGQPGNYRALLANDAVGGYALSVESPEQATLEYRVTLPPQHELEVAGMAEETLRQASRISAGAFYREEDLHRLAANIKPRTATFTQRQEVLLWNPLVLLLFVSLVTAEWVLRKFSNLS